MGLIVIAVIDVAAVAFGVLVVFSQPTRIWRDAAEHSRWFWFAWSTASAVVGLVPAATGVFGDGGAAVWLTACCLFALLQPAMWADVLEVRRDVARRRDSTLLKRAREAARVEASRVRWRDET